MGAQAGGAGPRLRTPSRSQSIPGWSTGRSHLVAQDSGTLGDTGGEGEAGGAHARGHAHLSPADGHMPLTRIPLRIHSHPKLFLSQTSHPDSHSHGNTVTLTLTHVPDSLTFIHKLTHCHTLTATHLLQSYRPTQVTLTVIYTQRHEVTRPHILSHCRIYVTHSHTTMPHTITCPHPLSHPVTTGDSHTKKSLRQSNARTQNDSHRRTLPHSATHGR